MKSNSLSPPRRFGVRKLASFKDTCRQHSTELQLQKILSSTAFQHCSPTNCGLHPNCRFVLRIEVGIFVQRSLPRSIDPLCPSSCWLTARTQPSLQPQTEVYTRTCERVEHPAATQRQWLSNLLLLVLGWSTVRAQGSKPTNTNKNTCQRLGAH